MTAEEQQRVKDISNRYASEGVTCGNGQKARNENECPITTNVTPAKPPTDYSWVTPLVVGFSIVIIIILLVAILVKLSGKPGKKAD